MKCFEYFFSSDNSFELEIENENDEKEHFEPRKESKNYESNETVANIENSNIEIENINILADKELLEVLLTNIIDNSIKASNQNSNINISIQFRGYIDYKS